MSTTVAERSDRPTVATGRAVDLPAWPVLVMLWGFPVMWLLGVTVIPMAVSMTLVMVSFLVRHRAAVVVPGVGAFGAFVLWTVPTALMLDSATRAMGFVFRGIILVFVLTAFVYTISAARTLTRRAVVSGLTVVWGFTIVGGVLGMLFPGVRLTTPVGMLLPGAIADNSYVRDLFFPPLAEVQHPWGSPTEFVRPSAPFPYANSWGVAVLLLTPVAVACFMMARSWFVRCLLLVAAVVLVAPAAATSNRGMFAALGLSAAYVVVRLALRNRATPVITLSVLGVAALLVLWSRGLFDQISQRQEYGQSNEARFTLYRETVERTLQSPLLGFGAPRPSTGQELSVGTQGYVWTLMFSYGFVGLGLFLLFLWGITWRTRGAADDVDVVLHSVLVVASLVILVYGLDIMQMLSLALVAAVLVRRRYGLEPAPPPALHGGPGHVRPGHDGPVHDGPGRDGPAHDD